MEELDLISSLTVDSRRYVDQVFTHFASGYQISGMHFFSKSAAACSCRKGIHGCPERNVRIQCYE
jgi:hypothetical protein